VDDYFILIQYSSLFKLDNRNPDFAKKVDEWVLAFISENFKSVHDITMTIIEVS